MCGRYFLVTSGDELAAVFDLATPPALALAPRPEIAPTQNAPVVWAAADGRRRLDLPRWALVAPWLVLTASRRSLINVRSETMAQNSWFRRLLAGSRCLVPAGGFYEWSGGKRGRKSASLIARPDGGLVAFAGLCSWTGVRGTAGGGAGAAVAEPGPDGGPGARPGAAPEGVGGGSFAILTTAANQVVSAVHDRMPVILPPETWARWLDPAVTDPVALTPLLLPAPERLLRVTPLPRGAAGARALF
ncbi:MAG: SOS response-associated peptidase [Planctomycetes bacterium]|nr:SOS response-associated peptidase [Planctomycetota bacterium]